MHHRRQRAVLVADDRERRIHCVGGRLLSTADTSTGMVVCCSTFCVCGAEHQPLDAPATVRSNEDQIAAPCLGNLENGLVRPVAGQDDRVVRNARHPRHDLGLGQDRAGLAGEMLVERRRRQHALERADAGGSVVRLGVEERDLRAERAGELDRLPHGLGRQRRVVERNHQVAVHEKSPCPSGRCSCSWSCFPASDDQYGVSPMIPARSILRWHGG